jgi:Domain of unknown function (DUF4296)
MMKKVVSICIGTFLLINACNNKGKILPVNTMKTIIWDLAMADELNNLYNLSDTVFLKKNGNYKNYQKVFYLHKITKKEFYKNYNHYQKNPVLFKELMDSVDAHGQREKNKQN